MITLPFGRALTVGDVETVPDDGHRYELVDGTLIVTPAPSYRHQSASMSLAVLLEGAAYTQVANVAADESWTAERPYPVTVIPSDLVR